MNAPAKITASLDADTFAMVERVSAAQGRSAEDFAAEAIRRLAETETDFRAFIEAGIDSLDRGEGIPHEQVMVELQAMIDRRKAQCAR